MPSRRDILIIDGVQELKGSLVIDYKYSMTSKAVSDSATLLFGYLFILSALKRDNQLQGIFFNAANNKKALALFLKNNKRDWLFFLSLEIFCH